VQPAGVALLLQRLAEHDVGCDLHHGDAGDLAQYGTVREARGSPPAPGRVSLAIHHELNVHQAAHFESTGKKRRRLHDLFDHGGRERLRG